MTVSDYLNTRGLGVESYMAVPSDRPASFLVVEQTGGSSDERFGTVAYVDVDCWSGSRRDAAALASSVSESLLLMPDEVTNVFDVSVTSLYDNPDMSQSQPQPRYTVGASIIAM